MITKNIMIVEDQLITQRLLKHVIYKNNLNLIGCYGSAEETLVALESAHCDIILLDIKLKSEVTGLDLARIIVEKNYNICIIFISAYGDTDTINKIKSTMASGYVLKPFTMQNIEHAIDVGYRKYLTQRLSKNQKNISIPFFSKNFFHYI